MKPTTAQPGTLEYRDYLLAEKYRLEQLVVSTIDPTAQAKLREDMRDVTQQLEGYYFDIPANQPEQ